MKGAQWSPIPFLIVRNRYCCQSLFHYHDLHFVVRFCIAQILIETGSCLGLKLSLLLGHNKACYVECQLSMSYCSVGFLFFSIAYQCVVLAPLLACKVVRTPCGVYGRSLSLLLACANLLSHRIEYSVSLLACCTSNCNGKCSLCIVHFTVGDKWKQYLANVYFAASPMLSLDTKIFCVNVCAFHISVMTDRMS